MTAIRSSVTHLFLLAIFWSLPFLASAYTISPKVLDIETEKRDLQVRDITLTNDNGQTRLYATVHEIALDENGEIKEFEYVTNSDRQDSITSWLEITRGRITLKPKEVRDIPLTIRINPNAKPGLYHAFVAFSNAGNKEIANERALAGKSPGVIVRIAIDQERTEFLRLENFTVERFVTDPTENVLSYTLTNPGEAEIVPRGEVIFYNSQGTEVGSLPINPEGSQVEPDDTVSFTSVVPEEFKVGKYKAFLSLEYGTEQLASLNDTTFFYVAPIPVIIAIFLGLLTVTILLTVLLFRRAVPVEHDGARDVSMYIRDGLSDSQDHDIDLKKQNKSE